MGPWAGWGTAHPHSALPLALERLRRILQSLKLIPLGVEGAERRVLTLRNPGIPLPRLGTTHTLIAAIQVIAGTEVAPSHRHTMAALRFIIEGEGACTVVNGEPESMQLRDLLLTPNWYWHGYFSEHPEPMIWLTAWTCRWFRD
jgi:gentisate 1,2-dioxygenase